MNTFLHFTMIMLLFNSISMNNDSVSIELQPNIYEISNQFFYSEEVRTYLIELEDQVLLFDIPTYNKELEAFIRSFEKPVSAILSHGSCGIADATTWQEKIDLKVYAHRADEDHPWLDMEPDVFFTKMPTFSKNLEVIHTPGHSAGSICLLDKNSKTLFSGDTFYANKKGAVKDYRKEKQAEYENLEDRIKSCKPLLKYDFEQVYPFHYERIDSGGKEKLRAYLSNL